jgi:tripartite-type tricarboxylate transporter receptor subunit TctC
MCIAAIIGMALWLLAAPAVAQEFFRGKTINMMVGFGPGAGMDTTARTIARHMPRFIPGAPNMLVQPMEGAAGLVAANYTARRAAPDGLTLSAPGRSFFVEAILKTPSVQFDPNSATSARRAPKIRFCG